MQGAVELVRWESCYTPKIASQQFRQRLQKKTPSLASESGTSNHRQHNISVVVAERKPGFASTACKLQKVKSQWFKTFAYTAMKTKCFPFNSNEHEN